MGLETLRTPSFFSHTQSLREVGGDRREAPNYIHGLCNYTFRFPLVVGFKEALSNFNFEMLCFPGLCFAFPLFIILDLFPVPSMENYLEISRYYVTLLGPTRDLVSTLNKTEIQRDRLANGFTTGSRHPESSPCSICSSPFHQQTS